MQRSTSAMPATRPSSKIRLELRDLELARRLADREQVQHDVLVPVDVGLVVGLLAMAHLVELGVAPHRRDDHAGARAPLVDEMGDVLDRLAPALIGGVGLREPGADGGRHDAVDRRRRDRKDDELAPREARVSEQSPRRHGRPPQVCDRTLSQPPVTLMWRATAGRLDRRSMTKSCPLGLPAIAPLDRLVQQSVVGARAQRRAQIGRVLLAEAHVERARAGEAHAVAALAEIVRERRDEAEPAAGFLDAHVARRAARSHRECRPASSGPQDAHARSRSGRY